MQERQSCRYVQAIHSEYGLQASAALLVLQSCFQNHHFHAVNSSGWWPVQINPAKDAHLRTIHYSCSRQGAAHTPTQDLPVNFF